MIYLRLVTFLLICSGLAVSLFIPDIVYRSEITEYFNPTDHHVKQFHELEQALGSQQNVVVLLETHHLNLLSKSGLNQLFEISKQVRALDGVTDVQSLLATAISDEQQNVATIYRYLKEGGDINESILGQAADNAQDNRTLLSADGRVATFSIDFVDEATVAALYPQIEAILTAQMPASKGRVLLLGPAEIKHALHQALLHDGFYLMPLILVCGLGMLWFFLRSWWLVFSGAVSIVVALWISAGLVGALKLTINQTSSLAFGVTFIIALADIIHLLMSYRRRADEAKPAEAMEYALRSNGLSLLLTSLTTGLGFLSLNMSDSPVFATFGNIAAIGVGCAFLTAITITPVLVLLVKNQDFKPAPDLFERWITKLNQMRSQLKPSHYWIFYALSLLIASAALLNQYHNDPLDYFKSDTRIAQATALSEQTFNVHHPVSIQLDSMRKDGVFDDRFLDTVNQFQNWLTAHSWVSQANSYSTRLRQLKRHLHNNSLKWSSAPTDAQSAADLWNLYQMSSPENTPASLKLDDEFRTAVVSIGTIHLQSSKLIAFEEEVQQWFANHNPDIQVSVTGHAMLFAGIGKHLTKNMLVGGLTTAVIISLLIGVFLGNLKLGILSLIPNLFPAGVVYGLWGMSVGVIDIAAAGTLSISLGIVVDDSIHILKRYAGYRKAGYSPADCSNKTFTEVGPALLLTTLILSMGMGLLTFSIFGPNETTATLLSSIIIVALLYDLIMLPHLLTKWDRWLFR